MNNMTNAEYFVHFNGGRPFRVVVEESGRVNVHRRRGHTYEDTALWTCDVAGVMVGNSPRTELTENGRGYGPAFDGNTLLLQCWVRNKYIWIGEAVIEFKTHSPVTEFVSPVGNNDVPYPYCVDEAGNIYLITEDVVLLNTPNRVRAPGRDPSLYYFKLGKKRCCSFGALNGVKLVL